MAQALSLSVPSDLPLDQIPQQEPVALRRLLGAVTEERDDGHGRRLGIQAGFAPAGR